MKNFKEVVKIEVEEPNGKITIKNHIINPNEKRELF
jgi:hypothetical protein